jgi:BirA family biotin operon repressor/biotin-[acetyl-CoA-carboxylase] ligase
MENQGWTGRLDQERIMERLETEVIGRKIILLETVDSTNSYLREMEDAPDGTVVIAGSQTGGRGRMGRSFHSPKEGGIYLSVLLRNTGKGFPTDLTTVAAALALRKSLLETTGTETDLKWVNDIYLRGYKVGGILTEGTFDMENRHRLRAEPQHGSFSA